MVVSAAMAQVVGNLTYANKKRNNKNLFSYTCEPGNENDYYKINYSISNYQLYQNKDDEITKSNYKILHRVAAGLQRNQCDGAGTLRQYRRS